MRLGWSLQLIVEGLSSLNNWRSLLAYVTREKSSQVIFIYIALFTMQIVSKQLYSDNWQIILEENGVIIQLN